MTYYIYTLISGSDSVLQNNQSVLTRPARHDLPVGGQDRFFTPIHVRLVLCSCYLVDLQNNKNIYKIVPALSTA